MSDFLKEDGEPGQEFGLSGDFETPNDLFNAGKYNEIKEEDYE